MEGRVMMCDNESKLTILTLDDILRNSRIDTLGEQDLLYDLGKVAEQAVMKALNRDWCEVEAEFGCIPAPIKQACLMVIDHYYTNRSATTSVNMAVLPYGVSTLIKPYVKLV